MKMADSITSWRLAASCSSKQGLLGSTTQNLIVFQDFFVDIDLPVSLTQNDEVSIPIAVYNYLKAPQKVRLEVRREPWFELMDDDVKEIEIGKNDITVVYFRIKVRKLGQKKLTVFARGTKMSDAIRRSIEVRPDGKEVNEVVNGRLAQRIERDLYIPPEAIDDASKIFVKFYPGIFSQVVEGVEGMFNMPHG